MSLPLGRPFITAYVAGFIVTWFFGFTTELLAEHNQVEEEYDLTSVASR